MTPNPLTLPATFRISPLVRLTLASLYLALTVPLPFLATFTQAPIAPSWLWGGIAIGFGVLLGALAERVTLDETGIQVGYPRWVLPVGRKGWSLPWSEVVALQPRTTGQGGLVYYVRSREGQGYLLPMRVVGFARLVAIVGDRTGIDTRDVRPLAQPWMYGILLLFTGFLLLIDTWVIWTAQTTPPLF